MFHEGREENLHKGNYIGNFHVSHQLLSMNDDCSYYSHKKQFNIVDQDIRQNKMVAG